MAPLRLNSKTNISTSFSKYCFRRARSGLPDILLSSCDLFHLRWARWWPLLGCGHPVSGLAPMSGPGQNVDVSLSKWNHLQPGDFHLRLVVQLWLSDLRGSLWSQQQSVCQWELWQSRKCQQNRCWSRCIWWCHCAWTNSHTWSIETKKRELSTCYFWNYERMIHINVKHYFT